MIRTNLFPKPGITITLFFFFKFLIELLTTFSGVVQFINLLFLKSDNFIPAL